MPRTLTAVAAALTLAAASLAAAPPANAAASGPAPTTLSFTAPGGTTWIVPKGLTHVDLRVVGAKGADGEWTEGDKTAWGDPVLGGYGDELRLRLPVTGGDTLTLFGATPGGVGKRDSPGVGFMNGGKGGKPSSPAHEAGGGGGAAAVKHNGVLVAVAAGGGGVGGAVHIIREGLGGNGGHAGHPGGHGYADKGGEGGSLGTKPGSAGGNGSSAASFTGASGGGGGGGGWPSGGGGRSGKGFWSYNAGGGGAGGTSYVSTVATDVTSQRAAAKAGFVEVSFVDPIQMTINAPAKITPGDRSYVDVFVADPAGTPLRGTVIVTSGTMLVGMGPLQNGVITLPLSLPDDGQSLPYGEHELTVEYRSLDRTETRKGTAHVEVRMELTGTPPTASETTLTLIDPPLRMKTGSTEVVEAALEGPDGPVAGADVEFLLNGAPTTVTTDAAGRAAASITAPSTTGTTVVQATFAGTAALNASTSAELLIDVYGEDAVVDLVLSQHRILFGEPLDATVAVRPADGSGDPATGVVLLHDGTDFIAMATLDGTGSAHLTDLPVRPATTEIRASYAGDGVYESAVSAPVTLTVATTPTATRIRSVDASGRAGDPVEVEVELAAERPSTREPHGIVELHDADGLVASTSIGADTDPTAADGVVRYRFSVEELPAGTHTFSARYLAADGYLPSASDPVSVRLTARETHLSVSPRDLRIPAGGTAVIEAHVSAQRGAGSAPGDVVEGRVQAYVGGARHGDPVEVTAGTATLRLAGLPVGRSAVRVVFHPDAVAFAEDAAAVSVEVVAARTPAASAGTGGVPQTHAAGPLADELAEEPPAAEEPSGDETEEPSPVSASDPRPESPASPGSPDAAMEPAADGGAAVLWVAAVGAVIVIAAGAFLLRRLLTRST